MCVLCVRVHVCMVCGGEVRQGEGQVGALGVPRLALAGRPVCAGGRPHSLLSSAPRPSAGGGPGALA